MEDPITGDSTRVLLAERVRPTCSFVRVVLLFATCWLLLLSVITIAMFVIEILIHIPIWTFSLPRFIFHAPASFLLVVYVGMKSQASLNEYLNPLNEVDDVGENNENNQEANVVDENVENTVESNTVDGKVESSSTNSSTSNKENNNGIKENNYKSFVTSFVLISILFIGWSWAAIMLGAGISCVSLRLQQIHATIENKSVLLPTSFFAGLFNMRNYISGLWLLNLFFCLSEKGLSTMRTWSDLYTESKQKTIALKASSSLFAVWKDLIVSLGTMAFKVGCLGVLLLSVLEVDRNFKHPGDIIFYAACLVGVGVLIGIVLPTIYGWKDQMKKTFIQFHDRLRLKLYSQGKKLVNLIKLKKQ